MPISIVEVNNNNLLDLTTWVAGSGSVPGFSMNGDAAENNRINDINPWGAPSLVWGTYSTGGNNADGGWNGSNITINNTKIYRFSVWVRRVSDTTSGNFYFGLHTNGTGDVYNLSNGVSDTNPYWDVRSISEFTKNQWYLVVGHIYPNNYALTTPHIDSGIYTITDGKIGPNKGGSKNDCKFGAGATTLMHRTYHFYCTDTTSRLQFFSPRIEEVNNYTPSIKTLLTTNLLDGKKPQGIIYTDGSNQSSKIVKPKDIGRLISIKSYTSAGSFTWTKPIDCTSILVKVVGGGGGGSGYCESGGAGGFSEKMIDVTAVSTVTVTVGGGGALAAYSSGNAGGTSSFGTYCSASGGFGSNRNYTHTGGYGGVGSGGDINLYGGQGTGHNNSTSHGQCSRGGESYWGSGNSVNRNGNPSSVGPAAPGTGGAGGVTDTGQVGTAGMPGSVMIWEYK